MAVSTFTQLEREAIEKTLLWGLRESSPHDQVRRLAASITETEEVIREAESTSAMKIKFGIIFMHLAVMADQLGTSLEQACADLVNLEYPEFSRFYNAQTPTWQRRHLWLSCLRGAINFSGLMTARYLGAVFQCAEEGARIHTSANPERCLEQALKPYLWYGATGNLHC